MKMYNWVDTLPEERYLGRLRALNLPGRECRTSISLDFEQVDRVHYNI